jgi:hypothetical protein
MICTKTWPENYRTFYSEVWFNTPQLAAAQRKQRYKKLVLNQTV